MATATILVCPNCDSTLERTTKKCDYCHQPVIVDSFSLSRMQDDQVKKYIKSYNKMLAEGKGTSGEMENYMAMCFLRLHQYDKALEHFDKALDESFDDSETYFMNAVCLLRGKKPFLAQRADINKAVSYLETACEIDEKPIYRQMLGYIKQDYFDRKYLNVSPSTEEEYARAEELGLSDGDIDTLVTLLNNKES